MRFLRNVLVVLLSIPMLGLALVAATVALPLLGLAWLAFLVSPTDGGWLPAVGRTVFAELSRMGQAKEERQDRDRRVASGHIVLPAPPPDAPKIHTRQVHAKMVLPAKES